MIYPTLYVFVRPGDRPRKLYAERALNLPLGAELITGNMWYCCQTFTQSLPGTPFCPFSCFLYLPLRLFPLTSSANLVYEKHYQCCVSFQRPALHIFQLGGSGRHCRSSRRLSFPTTYHPCAQTSATEDAPRDLPGSAVTDYKPSFPFLHN